MNLYQFRKKDLISQAVEVWGGTNIATRIDREHYILLYQLYDFYAEIYFHLDYHEVIAIKSFTDTDKLDPYYEQLHLSAFL